MFKSFTPLHDRVLIKPVDQGEKRVGAILVAELDEDRKTKFGKVVAIGPGRTSEFGTHIPVTVKVDDYVIVPKIGAMRIEIDGEEYWTIADKEIVAIVDYVED